mmetsp:Transcript_19020/g.43311  ORF Transcript_19020/g.43311 Transcript_19020/m.43311 type:complete len:97 (-) Transcript_19020:1334-1624(-)
MLAFYLIQCGCGIGILPAQISSTNDGLRCPCLATLWVSGQGDNNSTIAFVGTDLPEQAAVWVQSRKYHAAWVGNDFEDFAEGNLIILQLQKRGTAN